jgi:hypothetical protein
MASGLSVRKGYAAVFQNIYILFDHDSGAFVGLGMLG